MFYILIGCAWILIVPEHFSGTSRIYLDSLSQDFGTTVNLVNEPFA